MPSRHRPSSPPKLYLQNIQETGGELQDKVFTEKGRGYLEQLVDETQKIMDIGNGSVWRREYENGTVICNSKNTISTIELGGNY